jgi:drug/metabolite transporter (DMT)-like permease
MTTLPAISLAHPITLIAAVFTPWIALGIALLIGFFASYLTALSWADLTFVLPATAFGNVIVAIFARFWLHEAISLERWAGIALITLGVGFVAQGPSLTERPVKQIPVSDDHAIDLHADPPSLIAASTASPRPTVIGHVRPVQHAEQEQP